MDVCRYDEPSKADDLGTETDAAVNQKLYYHVVGTPQSEDAFLFASPDNPTWMCVQLPALLLCTLQVC